MIKREDLLAIARFKGLAPKFAELDYVQDVALANISREFGNRLVLKGGTCLYKVYQLNRFSEDLDFAAAKGFKAKDFFQRLPYFFGLLDITGRVKVKQFANSIDAYLEADGPFYDGRRETACRLILNISLRERIRLPIERHYYTPLYREIRSFDLFAMSEKEILAEKARAIYERSKARDVYDFWHLLKKGIPFDAGLAGKKLSRGGIKFNKGEFLGKICEKREGWERDLGALVAGELPPFSKIKDDIEKFLG